MKKQTLHLTALALGASLLLASTASAQIGRRFPSEKKVVPDPVTGIPLTFLRIVVVRWSSNCTTWAKVSKIAWIVAYSPSVSRARTCSSNAVSSSRVIVIRVALVVIRRRRAARETAA